MSHLSISARLVLLTVVLIGILLISNALLSRELSHSARALVEEAALVEALRTASRANRAFGELKYWLTDLAVSLLVRSEQQLGLARERLDTALGELEQYDQQTAAVARREVDGLVEKGMQAVEAYTDNRRVIGNSLMAAGRVHIAAVDGQLSALVDRLEREAIAKRDASIADADRAENLSIAIVVAASLLGLSLAWWILRSITTPLRRLVDAMSAITAGKLDTAIPEPTRDETGAMARTLALFRDSLVERDRLAAKQQRAEAVARHAEARLLTAIESISEGFSLYDNDDRLVLCNSHYREMLYPDMHEYVTVGTPFETVIRRAAERGLIRDAVGRIDAWVGDRLARHRSPLSGPSTQRRGDGRWIRVTERKTEDGSTVAVYADITEDKKTEEQLRGAKDKAEAALKELTKAQESLVHAEKMASLGQLTAGIAHEIKNPLNFVKNFAVLSIPMLEELKVMLDSETIQAESDSEEDAAELLDTTCGNLTKIKEHAERADRIVQSMLLHARGGQSTQQRVDFNSLIDDSLSLAYHGARAANRDFNVAIERSFDPSVGELELYPQDMTRVLINVITNAFYATQRRRAELLEPGYEPTLTVATRRLDDQVRVQIRDNGIGIAPELRKKIFHPFFTTKPPGEGTGLGLSLSYDIVVKQHNGQFDIDSKLGEFTEVTITLAQPAMASDSLEA